MEETLLLSLAAVVHEKMTVSSQCGLITEMKKPWVSAEDTRYQHQNVTPTVKHGGGGRMKFNLERPCQNPELNPIEILWHDLNRAIHIRSHKNIAVTETALLRNAV